MSGPASQQWVLNQLSLSKYPWRSLSFRRLVVSQLSYSRNIFGGRRWGGGEEKKMEEEAMTERWSKSIHSLPRFFLK
jgi:hypothetical protein